MPTNKTLSQLHTDLVQLANTTKLAILKDLGYTSESSYYEALKNSHKLSPAHREVFAKHFKVDVNQIDWQDQPTTKNLVA